MDLRGRRAWLHETELDLTTSEFEILTLFLSRPGVVLTRDEIMDKIRKLLADARTALGIASPGQDAIVTGPNQAFAFTAGMAGINK